MLKNMRVHFVGIGGIGVSALARYYLAKGHEVSGTDLADSEITEALAKQGISVSTGLPDASQMPEDTDQLIYSQAVLPSHPERQEAERRGIPQFSYPEALGELTKTHYTVSVSGTHGKSTTTSMLGLLLVKAGLDPTVIVGTKLKEFQDTNCRIGKGTYEGKPLLVIEADEYAEAFLHYESSVAVLTTVEPDHLDYFKTFEGVRRAFRTYVSQIAEEGVLVANKDEDEVRKIAESREGLRVVFYSNSQPEAGRLNLQVPGRHNVSNALAALTAARQLGVPDEVSFASLAEYRGSWRRFETFELDRFTLVSDYGHHPTEIRATVEAAREKWPNRELWLVFQPHQYHRTFTLFDDFVRVLSDIPVDRLLLTEIYDVAGREDPVTASKVSSRQLAETIGEKALYVPTLPEVEQYLTENAKGGEVVMVMGAGNVYNVVQRLTDPQGKEKMEQ